MQGLWLTTNNVDALPYRLNASLPTFSIACQDVLMMNAWLLHMQH